MQNSLERLFDGIAASLREDVAPAVEDPYAKAQVAATIELLANLAVRVEWRADLLREEIERIRAVLETAPERPAVLDAPVPLDGAGLLASRAAHLDALAQADPAEDASARATDLAARARARPAPNRHVQMRPMSDTITLEESDVQETFFENGWTDGLPIVPPTPGARRGDARRRDVIDERILIGVIPARGKGITLEQAAVHAVMAGCKPEYFPVVVAAFEALFDASFNAHTALTSTGGAALAVVVSGPIAQEIGMNGRHNCLGSGNRANLTIGRAVRLAAMNVLGARSGELDASSFGQPGQDLVLLRRGSAAGALAAAPRAARLRARRHDRHRDAGRRRPRQLAQQLNGDAEGILRTFATAMKTPSRSPPARAARGS